MINGSLSRATIDLPEQLLTRYCPDRTVKIAKSGVNSVKSLTLTCEEGRALKTCPVGKYSEGARTVPGQKYNPPSLKLWWAMKDKSTVRESLIFIISRNHLFK